MTEAGIIETPFGDMIAVGRDEKLVGLWFNGQNRGPFPVAGITKNITLPVLIDTRAYLNRYFAGDKVINIPIPLDAAGTGFQRAVWNAVRAVPWGCTSTYGAVAAALTGYDMVRNGMARAVGSAVGLNPILIFIPCHRILGAGGRLTGYSAGLSRKRELLLIEGIRVI